MGFTTYPVGKPDHAKLRHYAEQLGTSADVLAASVRVHRGDLFIWNDSDHVAIATGEFDYTDGFPDPVVFTFWPPPGEHRPNAEGSWARVDVVKIATVSGLTDTVENPPPTTDLDPLSVQLIRHGPGFWNNIGEQWRVVALEDLDSRVEAGIKAGMKKEEIMHACDIPAETYWKSARRITLRSLNSLRQGQNTQIP
jgi:hypothetical protein